MSSVSKSDIDKNFGKVLRKFRVRNGFTQEQLSEKLGISLKYISRIENGNNGIKTQTLINYMNLLGNNADNQPYIRQNDGTYIPKPPYVPTPEEAQAAKLSALDNEYAAKLDENKSSIIVAATVDQDEEYADQLRQERQALQAEYVQKRSEL